MNRIYWDSMLFIYWLEGKSPYSERIASIFTWMKERGDTLCTSAFTLGELLVAPRKTGDRELERQIIAFFDSGEMEVIPFQMSSAARFAEIRARSSIKSPDAIHLACAASIGVDLFLTNDAGLRRLTVPGIRFIDGIDSSLVSAPGT